LTKESTDELAVLLKKKCNDFERFGVAMLTVWIREFALDTLLEKVDNLFFQLLANILQKVVKCHVSLRNA